MSICVPSIFDFSFVVTDPRQHDNPIIFASAAFLTLTGYTAEEVIGRNCRFLQGPETERRHLMELRDSFREERPCKICLLNYKKNGEKFWNQLYVEPIRDSAGQVTRYAGIQTNVTDLIEARKVHSIKSMEDADLKHVVDNEVREVGSVAKWILEGNEKILAQDKEACSVLPSSLLTALDRIQQSFVLVDPSQPDMPIVHAGEGFLKLTGYPREKIIGRNCRFLQGPLTDKSEVAKIRKAIDTDPPQSVTVTMLNYRYDGTPFWNALHIAPVRGADGCVAYLAGVQLNANDAEKDVDPLCKPPIPITINSNGDLQRTGRRIPHCGGIGLQQLLMHNGTVGEVRMAIRSLSGSNGGLRRSIGKADSNISSS